MQEDQINSSYVENSKSSQVTNAASATASFAKLASITTSFSSQIAHKDKQDYLNNRLSTEVIAFGGKLLGNISSIDDWLLSVPDNLVTMDRNGVPIWFLMTPKNFPMLPFETITKLSEKLENATTRYYIYNRHNGCTDVNSINFDFRANVDDGSCVGHRSNFSFGGIFQKCVTDGCTRHREKYGVLPDEQTNPLTGSFTCLKGYDEVELAQFDSYIDSYFLFIETAHWRYKVSTFWCAAKEEVPNNSGLMFGGTYSDSGIVNPVTGGKSCPHLYWPLTIGTNTHGGIIYKVCVSSDVDEAYQVAVPFAGFYSCYHGNPLALPSSNKLLQGRNSHADVYTYLKTVRSEKWPKQCPRGYSPHLLGITKHENCQISYCIKVKSLKPNHYPIIKPPYNQMPSYPHQNEVIFTRDLGKQLTKVNGNWIVQDKTTLNTTPSLNGAVTENAAIVLTAFVGILAIVSVSVCIKKKHNKLVLTREYENLLPTTITNTNNDSQSLNSTEYGTNEEDEILA